MSDTFLAALGAFLSHLAVGLALTAGFLVVYIRLTPHAEVRLMREGNTAAAIGLIGALIGFAIVLSRAIAVSNGLGETIVWGVIALVVQIAGHYALRLAEPRLHVHIEQGSMTAATVTAGTAVALGLINAASMTP